jgi:hypothetical protein
VLETSCEEWEGPETQLLATSILSRVKIACSKSGLVARHWPKIHRHGKEENGSTDLAVLKPVEQNSGGDENQDGAKGDCGAGDGRALLLLAVGTRHKDWWKKVRDGISRIKGILLNTTESRYKIQLAAPLLMAVVTIERGDKAFQSGRLGAFLVTPKAKEFRVCLLSRVESGDLTGLSRAFGRVLRAARCLAILEADPSVGHVPLGPACCRIGNKVRARGLSPRSSSCAHVTISHNAPLLADRCSVRTTIDCAE